MAIQVFAAAVLVGNPFTLFARVVKVEHRGHGVDAEAVNVHVFQPEDARWTKGSSSPHCGRN